MVKDKRRKNKEGEKVTEKINGTFSIASPPSIKRDFAFEVAQNDDKVNPTLLKMIKKRMGVKGSFSEFMLEKEIIPYIKKNKKIRNDEKDN